ncbi:HAD domain-containing protein [Cupriavidus basilensis]|uniref:HAD domain-containing protein n=1 Tax=Cupriavidus basilensis TaxID=68895 RepID=UPI0023E8E87F|nr:HAD domain-containing protein [Cupriavidus basilensis]MDF3883061.1 HAD domain-containing protein [Cupriavidus basilensis]
MTTAGNPNPLVLDAAALGQLVRQQRQSYGLSVVDVALGLHIAPFTLARLENGEAVNTDVLFRALTDLGLAVLVMPKARVGVALAAVGHTANWNVNLNTALPARRRSAVAELPPANHTPTLFLGFDGTLHAGHALMDAHGQISLDSGRPLFEFAPLLVAMLAPYPAIEIVLTTAWLQTLPLEVVVAHLPPELANRVVGTTKDIKPRFGDMKNGTDRTATIASYALGKGLANWLAVDDSVHGAYKFGREPGELLHHFVLLDAERGISDEQAQRRVRAWLAGVLDRR